MKNYGIITNGSSSIKARTIGVGENVEVNNQFIDTIPDSVILDQKLIELINLLKINQDQISNSAELIESAKLVQAEIHKPNPDKSKIRVVIDTVKSSVSFIKDVASVASTIEKLVGPYII